MYDYFSQATTFFVFYEVVSAYKKLISMLEVCMHTILHKDILATHLKPFWSLSAI